MGLTSLHHRYPTIPWLFLAAGGWHEPAGEVGGGGPALQPSRDWGSPSAQGSCGICPLVTTWRIAWPGTRWSSSQTWSWSPSLGLGAQVSSSRTPRRQRSSTTPPASSGTCSGPAPALPLWVKVWVEEEMPSVL